MTMSGKARGLALLSELGLSVPPYVVLSWEALTGDLVLTDRPSAALRRELAERLEQSTVLAGLRALTDADPSRRYAVRSSASAEDGTQVSFAGIFRSFLNVPADALADRVADSMMSLLAPASRIYSQHQALDLHALDMDIIVQAMVDADCSGVLFTVHPQGLVSECVIQVGEGLGEGVVSGETPVTSYYYNPVEGSVYDEPSEGSPRLDEAQLALLQDAAVTVRRELGEAYDLEFAIADGELHFLQLRPITTLPEGPRLILDNANIVESYPGITLPLSLSFAALAYRAVFGGLARRMLGRRRAADPGLEPLLGNMVARWHGRLYYQISNWYRALQCLPRAERLIPIWQDMMGVRVRDYEDAPPPLGRLARLGVYLRAGWQLLTTPLRMRRLDRWFRETEGEVRRQLAGTRERGALVALFWQLHDRLVTRWDITLVNDLYAFVFTGLLRRDLPDDAGLSAEALAGLDALASLEPVAALHALVALPEGPDYEAARADFLQRFGDRSPEELKLETETFRAFPERLDETVAYYRAEPEQLAERVASIARQQRREAEAKAKLVARSGLAARHLGLWRSRARLGIRNRELSRFHRSRIYGLVREILRALAADLVAVGRLSEVEDAFYLELDELLEPAEQDLQSLVEARRARYALYRRLPAYARVIFAGPLFEKQHARIGDLQLGAADAALRGSPCSNGVVEGEVLIVEGNERVQATAGKILVARLTDPGWVYLLLQAKGLITEKGSLLSHTGIISRELNLPAITGVRDATRLLRSGERIRMDGSTGEITRLDGVDNEEG